MTCAVCRFKEILVVGLTVILLIVDAQALALPRFETRFSIATALLFFHDSKAQAATQEAFKGKEAELNRLRAEIKSKGWKILGDY